MKMATSGRPHRAAVLARRARVTGPWTLQLGARLERGGLVGPLPGELGLGAAEVAEGGRLLVDRAPQVQLFHDAARRQLEVRAHELGDLLLGNPAGAFRVHHDRDRIGHANRVGELHQRPVGDAGRHDVLGDVARHVAGRAIDLRRILARERAAAVRRRSAVGVDDDLAAGDAGVAVRTADDEAARRVDVDLGVACPSSPRESPC